jgi:hypothetical protein
MAAGREGVRSVSIWLVAVLAGCFSRAANQRYEQGTARVRAIYATGVTEIDRSYAQQVDAVEKLRDALIPVVAGANFTPEHPLLTGVALIEKEKSCERLAAEAAELQSLGESAVDEVAAAQEYYTELGQGKVNTLVAAYWAADLAWIADVLRVSPADVELEPLFVYSHNLRLNAYIEARLSAAEQEKTLARSELDAARDGAMSALEERRQSEIADAKRRFGMAMAAVGQAMAQSNANYSRAPTYSATTYSSSSSSSSSSSFGTCSSDFQCGVGSTCVKPNFSATGTCMRQVNEYGVQTYDLPDMNSVFVRMPSASDCTVVGYCPAGFVCDLRSGACLR